MPDIVRYYELGFPFFRCNSSATEIECIIGLTAIVLSEGASSARRVVPDPAVYPASHVRAMRYTYQGITPFSLLRSWAACGVLGNLTIGYAITADSGDAQEFQITDPTQSDYRAVATLPISEEIAGVNAPLISQQVIRFTFPMPSRRSTFFLGYKSSGGSGTALPLSTSTGNYDIFFSPNNWVREIGGFVTTWHSSGVSISASGGASVGNTSRLTITVPDSVRTLTVNDFTASGGTLSNFTKVS